MHESCVALRFRIAAAATILVLAGAFDSATLPGASAAVAQAPQASADDPAVLPGAPPFDPELLARFGTKRSARGAAYRPRTRHLHPDGSPVYTNRLFLESSPYLLQHAHNPVNWYPWGDEAFERAKRLNRPVLLSVGYSTCHWCHVMEEESFEDPEIAEYLNRHYVAIKVDREERPDIDAIYMTAVQTMTGHGGWPMTVWLTPERKPFFGGTYFPARDGDRGARSGFLTLLHKLHDVYEEQHEQVLAASERLSEILAATLAPQTGGTVPGAQLLHEIAVLYSHRYDAEHGGVRGAPKFPSGYPVRLLLRYYRRTGYDSVLAQVNHTLTMMAAGGIHDHIGGGFHRYATDSRWRVPHFEKMLYDNALLAIAYLEAWQATGDARFKAVVEDILRYVERDMTAPAGAFFSATDADSPAPGGGREEGWFFTWTPAELDAVLDAEDARLVKAHYHVTEEGNFEGRNILYADESLARVAARLGMDEQPARRRLEAARELLYEARRQRPPPLRDEKILTAWNGLMISAYARAGLVLERDEYVQAARRAAHFVLRELHDDARLYRSYKDGAAKLDGYLEDYAFFIAALLDLYEATFEIEWLSQAIALDGTLERLFEDKDAGGFFMTGHDHEKLLAREKPAYDGAEPSGNSVAVMNLLRLAEFTTDDRYRRRAQAALEAFAGRLQAHPSALSEMLVALDFQLDMAKEIIIVTPEGRREDADPLLAELRKIYLPNRILAIVEEGAHLQRATGVIPLLEGKRALRGRVTAYVCEQGICELPTSDPGVFSKQIAAVEKLGQ